MKQHIRPTPQICPKIFDTLGLQLLAKQIFIQAASQKTTSSFLTVILLMNGKSFPPDRPSGRRDSRFRASIPRCGTATMGWK